jgi:hypothetical protein
MEIILRCLAGVLLEFQICPLFSNEGFDGCHMLLEIERKWEKNEGILRIH